MRRTLVLSLLAPTVWAACSGGDNTVVDAGPDVTVKDVVVEYNPPETTPPKPVLSDVTAGAQHTCVLVDYNGQYVTYCFGLAAALGATPNGILAVASNGKNPQPNLLSLASGHGASHTCGIDTSKQVWCWGDNSFGQCGQGNTNTPVTAPQIVVDFQFGIAKATAMGAGTKATCIVRSLDGKLECFGDNTNCASDQYDDAGCSASVASATTTADTDAVFHAITLVTEGAQHGCVAASGYPSGTAALYCFGDNASLESGPAGKAITTPAAKVSTVSVVSVAAGDTHTCFITDSPHQLYCFGKNDVHQASPTSTTTPIDPSAATAITLPQSATPIQVAVRAAETCVVDAIGNVWCFGTGHGTNIDQVAGVKDVGKLTLGAGHACAIGHTSAAAITDPSQIVCWGDNTNGQAGQTAGGTITPTAVTIPQTAP